MIHFKSLQLRLSFRAALLGLLSLVTSLYLLKLGTSPLYSIGDIFLLLVASSSGGLGSFIAVCIAEVPLLLTGSHDIFQVLQSLFFVTLLGVLVRRQASLQSLLLMLPAWWAATAVAYVFEEASFHTLVIKLTLSIFVLAMVRLLLLSPLLSQWVFGKQQRLPIASFIPEILFILSSFIGGIILFTQHQSAPVVLEIADALGNSFFIAYSLIAVLPVLLGMMLTRTLISEYGIELKNLISNDGSKKSFVSMSRSLLGQRPDGEHLFRDTPKNSIGFSSDESIIFCTAGAAEILHLTSASLIGKRIQQASIAPTLIDGISRLLIASRLRGTAQDEVRIVLPDGKTSKFIELSMNFSKESFDSSSGWLATVTDITHKRTVEAELLRAKKIEMLGVMSHGIAHSVADALTVIQSITSLSSDNKAALEEIRAVAGNAGATIKQLLEYGSEHQIAQEEVNFKSLLESRLEFFKQTIGDDACIEYNCHTDFLPVMIDERAVLQAISHLLINAKESYPSQDISQRIELTLDQEEISSEFAFIQPGARAGRYARVRVKDHGEGMTLETLGKVFDPLYSTKNGHTGLGLSVVFAVMRSHDGFLTAESTLKNGTTISLYFPLTENKADELFKSSIQKNQNNSLDESKKLFHKAIIVEDDDAVRRILELLLKQIGITTVSYISAEEALSSDALEGDFFITDLILPGMQGVELAAELVKKLTIPGLIATGGSLDSKKLPQRTALLPKPYGLEELIEKLKELKTI